MSYLKQLFTPSGAGMALKIAEKGFSQAKQKSVELYGYDFFGLIQKLIIFYVIALIIAKYYEAVKYGSGFVGFIAGLFGYEIPKVFPESLMRFFDTGYNGVKYWDLIHVIAILLVTAEALRHENANQPGGMNPTSWGIFGLIGGFIALISVPDMLQRVKESGLIQDTNIDPFKFNPPGLLYYGYKQYNNGKGLTYQEALDRELVTREQLRQHGINVGYS